MKTNIKFVSVILLLVFLISTSCLVACSDANMVDQQMTQQNARNMVERQPTPTDITYSLSRYNLIRRAYYYAGEFDKVKNLPCEVKKPEGYLYLFVEGVGCVKVDTIDGVVTSMRSYLTPDSEEYSSSYSEWLADVDGTYGENPDGIFYFDKNGEYHEWTGLYYYSEHYYKIDDPMLREIAGEFEAG